MVLPLGTGSPQGFTTQRFCLNFPMANLPGAKPQSAFCCLQKQPSFQHETLLSEKRKASEVVGCVRALGIVRAHEANGHGIFFVNLVHLQQQEPRGHNLRRTTVARPLYG
jgi:hypothetical protein